MSDMKFQNDPRFTCQTKDCGLAADHAELFFVTRNGKEEAVLRFFCANKHINILRLIPEGTTQVMTPPPRDTTIRAKVSGVTFPNQDGTSRQDLLKCIKAGDALTLVTAQADGKQVFMLRHAIGIIGSLRADAIRDFLVANPGKGITVKVVKLTGGEGEKATIGCNIELSPNTTSSAPTLLSPMPTHSSPTTISHDSQKVYLDPDGRSIFHTEPHCSGIKNAQTITLAQAKYKFHARPCKRCAASFITEH